MASSKIKGITIVINGETKKLNEALKNTDKMVYSLNGDLKALNQALKLDPKNTELLAQKYEVLKRNIFETQYRLDMLKEAQRQMGDYNKLTEEQKSNYNQLSLEIAKAENALSGMNAELKNTSKLDLSSIQNGLKKVGEVALDVSKKMLQIGAAIGGALVGGITASVKSYADLEKAQRGSERLFGDSFSIVKNNAVDAYRTMGLSATQYYDQVNTYVVGLKNSLRGDTKRAAELANNVLKAQADIVAATGANTDTVQNAFAAVMRGNYTMLDNLRLGIKGSKTGMQEVIQKVNEWNKANGKATRYQMDNYADMQQALVDYVKMVGVAGTAQQQMSETISGSFSQMKSAFTNLLSGIGDPSDLSSTIKTFLNNIIKAIRKLAPSLLKGFVSVFKDIIPKLISMTGELMPIILDGVKGIIDGLIKFINDDAAQFRKIAVDILNSIVNFILKNLPLLLEASIKIISELAIGIAQSAPTLIPSIIECIMTIVETLIENIDLLINAGMELIIGIAEGLILGIPTLVSKVPQLISKLVSAFTGKEIIKQLKDIGKNIVDGIWEGIKNTWTIATSVDIPTLMKLLIYKIKDFLGIASPSKVMRDQIGKNIGLGVVAGINDTVEDVENAMSNLSSKVEASVNPTINPTANSNPLYITIDKFYNNRGTDVQQLAEELEFYRRNSALAKGGV